MSRLFWVQKGSGTLPLTSMVVYILWPAVPLGIFLIPPAHFAIGDISSVAVVPFLSLGVLHDPMIDSLAALLVRFPFETTLRVTAPALTWD